MLDEKRPRSLRRTLGYWIRLVIAGGLLLASLLALFAGPWLQSWYAVPQASPAASATQTLPATPAASPTPAATSPAEPAEPLLSDHSLDGHRVLSLSELGYAHLFSHQLSGAGLTRLTYGEWDDIEPALSPDGARLAFASNRGGNWDLYMVEMATGTTTALTQDAAYDGQPSWSSNDWLAYTHDLNGNLEVAIRPLDGSLEPVYVSLSAARDHSPSWRPGAQQLAFISDRDGGSHVWLLHLDQEGEARFVALAPGRGAQASPAWSPDGRLLAWAEQDQAGVWGIYISDLLSPPRYLGSGQAPSWSPAGDVVLASLALNGQEYLSAYRVDGSLALAPQALPGQLHGSSWAAGSWPQPLPEPLQAAAAAQPQAIWANTLAASTQRSQHQATPLLDVYAPNATLSSAAAAPFEALRARSAQLLGWDALSSLENALTPLTSTLAPGQSESWLYTGRAFELRSGLLNAGWLAAVREDQDGQTYWRIYLRSANPQGGLGKPLTQLPWDFAARYRGVENSYQAGGAPLQEIPAGYWVDFTALAAEYGFERLPSQSNWRSFFPALRFNQFVLRAGLSWNEAMQQLYSAEELSARP
ncbi:MAG: PD40 domain-containing protein [Anaerolineales bacterium]|nr:PD40 domain-containing protein [Anaerolineales bacterium]